MIKSGKAIPVRFYAELSGREPVREWLLGLEDEDRKKIGNDIMIVQYEWPIGLPLVRSLGEGFWEIRSDLLNSISRIIFIFMDGHIVLLHGFIKKTQKISPRDNELAKSRAKKYKARM